MYFQNDNESKQNNIPIKIVYEILLRGYNWLDKGDFLIKIITHYLLPLFK